MMIPWLRLCRFLGWGVLGLGLLLQFGLKDHVFGLRLLFYAMPKPCLLAVAVTLLVWPKAGWASRLAALAVAGLLEISLEALASVRCAGELPGPVLE